MFLNPTVRRVGSSQAFVNYFCPAMNLFFYTALQTQHFANKATFFPWHVLLRDGTAIEHPLFS